MIAPIFFTLLMGMMEVGIIYFVNSTLQYAVNDVARQIRTGQIQQHTPPISQTDFRNKVCDDIQPLLQCNSNLQIDVQNYPDYGPANFSDPVDANGNLIPLSRYNLGNPCDVVLVRAFYTWPVFTPLLSTFLANLSNGSHLVAATAAFRNEPYNAEVSGC